MNLFIAAKNRIGSITSRYSGTKTGRKRAAETEPKESLGIVLDFHFLLKVGVHMNSIFSPLNVGLMKISRLRFKQSKNPLLISRSYVVGCFVNFWVIFGYIWVEIVFLKGLEKFREIRKVEDLMKFKN